MASTSPHQFRAKSIGQIGILVKDCEKVSEDWERMLGIGPWTIRELSHKDAEGRTVVLFKIAFANLGGVEIELAQPVEGKTYHKEFVDTHGEVGLHHICFFVDDVDAELSNFVAQGAKVLAQTPGRFAYFETGGPGGVIFELLPTRGEKPDASK